MSRPRPRRREATGRVSGNPTGDAVVSDGLEGPGRPLSTARGGRDGRAGQQIGHRAALQFPIHFNIELHLPATAEQDVYDALFKSIRQNLMS